MSASNTVAGANRPIVVGSKPTANYALAVATRLGEGQRTIVLRARGRLAGAALDAANKALNMGLPLKRGEARWGQENGPEGKPVSFLEIALHAEGVN